MFSILFFLSLLQGIVWEVFSVVEEYFKLQELQEIEHYVHHLKTGGEHTNSSPSLGSDYIGQIDFEALKLDGGDDDNDLDQQNKDQAKTQKFYLRSKGGNGGCSPLTKKHNQNATTNQYKLIELTNELYQSPERSVVVPAQSMRGQQTESNCMTEIDPPLLEAAHSQPPRSLVMNSNKLPSSGFPCSSPQYSKVSLEKIDSVPASSTTQLITDEEEIKVKGIATVPQSIEKKQKTQQQQILTTPTKLLSNEETLPRLLYIDSSEEIIPDESLANVNAVNQFTQNASLLSEDDRNNTNNNMQLFSFMQSRKQQSEEVSLLQQRNASNNRQSFEHLQLPGISKNYSLPYQQQQQQQLQSVPSQLPRKHGSYESTGIDYNSVASSFKITTLPIAGVSGFSATKSKVFTAWNSQLEDQQKQQQQQQQLVQLSPSTSRFRQIHVPQSTPSEADVSENPQMQKREDSSPSNSEVSVSLKRKVSSDNDNDESQLELNDVVLKGFDDKYPIKMDNPSERQQQAVQYESKPSMTGIVQSSSLLKEDESYESIPRHLLGPQLNVALSEESRNFFVQRVSKLQYQSNLSKELQDLEDFICLQDSVGLRQAEQRRTRIMSKHKSMNMFSISKQHALEKRTYLRDNPLNKNYNNLKAFIQSTEYALGYANSQYQFTNNNAHLQKSNNNNNYTISQQSPRSPQNTSHRHQDSINENQNNTQTQSPRLLPMLRSQLSSSTPMSSIFVKLSNMFSFVLHMMMHATSLKGDFIVQKLFLVEQSINEIIFGTYNEQHPVNHFKFVFSAERSHYILMKIFDKQQRPPRKRNAMPTPLRRQFSKQNFFESREKIAVQEAVLLRQLTSEIAAPWAQFKKAFMFEKTVYFVRDVFQSANPTEKRVARYLSDQLQFMRGHEFCLADLTKHSTEMFALYVTSSNNALSQADMRTYLPSSLISFICTRTPKHDSTEHNHTKTPVRRGREQQQSSYQTSSPMVTPNNHYNRNNNNHNNMNSSPQQSPNAAGAPRSNANIQATQQEKQQQAALVEGDDINNNPRKRNNNGSNLVNNHNSLSMNNSIGKEQQHILEVFHYIQTFFASHSHLLSNLIFRMSSEPALGLPCYEYS